jgi:hypothetical protein
VPPDERVEVDGIEISAFRIGEARNISTGDRLGDPVDELPASRDVGITNGSSDATQPAETLPRKWANDFVVDAQQTAPRHRVAGFDSLLHFREGHRGEVQHRLRREQIEMRHCLVRAGDEKIDLLRLGGEKPIISLQHVQGRAARASLRIFERERQPLYRKQTPRNSRRKERIDEGIRVRHQHPAFIGGASQPMLYGRMKSWGKERLGLGEERTECRIPQ